jgi:hypothetical protein
MRPTRALAHGSPQRERWDCHGSMGGGENEEEARVVDGAAGAM